MKTPRRVRPAPFEAECSAWKYASSLSQPEQPQVSRNRTGPLAVSSARSSTLPLASLILNAGAGAPTSTLVFGGSAADAVPTTNARARATVSRRFMQVSWVGRGRRERVTEQHSQEYQFARPGPAKKPDRPGCSIERRLAEHEKGCGTSPRFNSLISALPRGTVPPALPPISLQEQ